MAGRTGAFNGGPLEPGDPPAEQRARHLARGTGCETGEPERAHRHPDQAQRRVADRGRHAPHLAVAALADGELEPRGRNPRAKPDRRTARGDVRLGDVPDVSRRSHSFGQGDAAGQCRDRRRLRHAFNLRPVHFFDAVPRVADQRLQPPGVRQQQQALAVIVETTGRVKPGQRQVVGEAATVPVGRKPRQHPEWLIEKNESHRARMGSMAEYD
jgi:hypothetical protein